MRSALLILTLFFSFLTVSTTIAGERAIIVFDASGSMWGQISGKTKIEIARETLGNVLPTFSADMELGLIAYGHRKKGECGDIESIVAPSTGNREAISKAVNNLNPKGKTPLSDAVRQAAAELKFTEDKATVILLTDGIETCDADPCALASELEQKGVDFTAHVVGFGLSKEEGQQVACLAENTGGKFILARDAGELSKALEETVVAVEAPKEPEPTPKPAVTKDNVQITALLSEGSEVHDLQGRYDIFKMDGEQVAEKRLMGGYATKVVVTLEPGRYLMRYKKDMATSETVVEVLEGELVERDLVLNAGVLQLSVAPEASLEADKSARIDIYGGSDQRLGGYGPKVFVATAGPVELVGKIGNAEVSEKIVLKAGEILEKKLIAAAGRLVGTAVYSQGGEAVQEGGIRFDVLSHKKDLQGKRKRLNGSYSKADYMLPPGKYVLRAKLGSAVSEVDVEIEGGSLTETTINMNAGVVEVTVLGGYRIDIFEAKKDLQGRRKRLNGAYGEVFQTTLSAGEYVAIAKIGSNQGEQKESGVIVKAGERTEISID
ncbi:MAG: vWA domain-containing protein [Rhizobiaceae bacterium]